MHQLGLDAQQIARTTSRDAIAIAIAIESTITQMRRQPAPPHDANKEYLYSINI
ncbi:hypothetical protein [Paraburkholderia bannensis]|uniref:hypothetical protein n=1 Tax=Paraburkholderia bannensis TaxID=765414 RepID=UPI002AC3409E|nr:hypothetical protein [Paraburkholderia bannensis]